MLSCHSIDNCFRKAQVVNYSIARFVEEIFSHAINYDPNCVIAIAFLVYHEIPITKPMERFFQQ